MEINMNDMVRVKLKPIDHERLRKQHDKLFESFGQNKPAYKARDEDADGFSEWHLWELFQAFGEYCYMGNNYVPFGNIIFLKDRADAEDAE